MIERMLQNATLYELVQTLTGAQRSEAKVREILGPEPERGVILDVGGGTGIMARVFDARRLYCCMDLDLERVKVARGRGAQGLVGDATKLPIGSATVDLAIQRAVSHHLTDDQFAAMTAETRRVLKPGGRLLFLDATWSPSFIPGRLMWRIDQGSHPRTEKHMRAVLEACFEIERATSYSIFHRYFLAIARPRAAGAAFG